MINVSGVDLMRQINDGLLKKTPTAYIAEVRGQITEACEELLDSGARIRPLISNKQQVGWVRGLHLSERRILSRWLIRSEDLLVNILSLATSFSVQELEDFTNIEIRSLLNIVSKMSEYDASLFPYLSAYVTTMSSENLWHGKGVQLSAFENRNISLPDGKQIRILTPSPHARLWATLCTYREQAKKRLDENFNAVLIIRPWAGKSADPIAAELRALARSMTTDAMEPWQNIIQIKSEVDVNDGWAHPGDSIEDLKREMNAFIEGKDKHEQVMAQLEKQMHDEAEGRRQKLNEVIQRRGGPGVVDEVVAIRTDAEVRQTERDLKRGRPVIQPVQREEREVVGIPSDQIKKYR
jgi:hypothetical protein